MRPAATARPAAIGAFVPQPAGWVPFSADLRKTSESGRTWVGRFYRSSDGSTRSETARSETGHSLAKVEIIGIKNISRQKFYMWKETTGWTEQPMQLPSKGWRPARYRASTVIPTSERIEGFDIVLKRGAGGVSYLAPQLNMFAVVRRPNVCGNRAECGIRFLNIKGGEQPASLFEPSTDEIVIPLAQPGGIVRSR